MRTEILTAARKLFIEHGFSSISMRTIAAAVGVSKPALYYYFKDKESLFLAVFETFLEEFQEIFVELPGERAKLQLTAVAKRIMQLPLEQRAMIRLVSQESNKLPVETRKLVLEKYRIGFLDRIEVIFMEGIRLGEFRAVAPHIATWALLGLLYPYTFVGFEEIHADEQEVESAGDQVLAIFFDGISV